MLRAASLRLVITLVVGLVIVADLFAAPLYWHPSAREAAVIKSANSMRPENVPSSGDPTAPLVFVGITPCRMMDTRGLDSTFTGAYGSPALTAGATRTLPVAGVTAGYCSLPSTAQAVSLNVTLWPNAGTRVQWLSLWPAGQTQPVVSTINDYQGTVFSSGNGVSVYGINNAAIVPLGTGGAFNVYVTDATNLFIDVNGYYMAPSAFALGAGTASAPSVTFSNDTNSGLYSPVAGVVNVTSAGNQIVSVGSTGLSVYGNISATGYPVSSPSGYAISGPSAYLSNTYPNFNTLTAVAGGTGNTAAISATVNSSTGLAGDFYNGVAGMVLRATVNNNQVMNVDQNGLHAGPALTGTPFAYGSFDASGTQLGGSSNISCPWNSGAERYECTLTGANYSKSNFIVVVTAQESTSALMSVINTASGGNFASGVTGFAVRLFNISGTIVQNPFTVVVFKP